MPPKARADGVNAVPSKRTRKAATPASDAKPVTKPVTKAVAKPAAAKAEKPKTASRAAVVPAVPAADTVAQRRIGGGWLAVGVGSAALVAALLFATRGKRNDWSK
mgnify:FL=1